MRLLRYIGPGNGAANGHADGTPDVLIVEDAHNGEQFGLFLDDGLRGALSTNPPPAAAAPSPAADAAIADSGRPIAAAFAAPSAPRAARTGPPQPLTPREIQVRVRAGETPEDLAAEAGVSPDRIVRFAYAVLQERLRVGAEARRARARRGGPEGEMLPFGETVDARFEEHGISAQDIAWDAVREGDGPWTVIARWRSGELESSARWSFLLGARTVVPDDDTAMELLSDRPVQRNHGVPLTMVAMPAAPEDDASDAAGNLRRLPPRPDDQFFDQDAPNDGQVPASQPAAPGFSGLRAVPNQSGPSTTAPGTTAPPAPPAPALGAFFDGEPTLPLDLPEPVRAAPQRALVESDDLIEADDLPPRAAPPAAQPTLPDAIDPADEVEDEQSSRARIPSWDDILLGVRRKRD